MTLFFSTIFIVVDSQALVIVKFVIDDEFRPAANGFDDVDDTVIRNL